MHVAKKRERLYAEIVALGMNVQSNYQCKIIANITEVLFFYFCWGG